MTRLGYYVEGEAFYGKKAQAEGRAKFLADEFGRNVDVTYVGVDGQHQLIGTASPADAEAEAEAA